MPTLDELERQLALLTEIRNVRVTTARAAMQRANAEYDRQALPLARQIEKLRVLEAQPAPSLPAQRVSKAKEPVAPDPDWSAEEKAHFLQLTGRNGRG